MNLKFDSKSQYVLSAAAGLAADMGYCFVTPEHLLCALTDIAVFRKALASLSVDADDLKNEILGCIKESDACILSADDDFDDEPENGERTPHLEMSYQLVELIDYLEAMIESSSAEIVKLEHLVAAILSLKDSQAAYHLLTAIGGEQGELIRLLIDGGEGLTHGPQTERMARDEREENKAADEGVGMPSFAVDMATLLEGRNPLIGRETELERTISVLCRKDKNNVIHIGEPGVGKTAIVYGLARRIADGDVPARLQGATLLKVDMGPMLQDTRYRGDFEKRMKQLLDYASANKNTIIYIDEIHTIVGAGATSDSSIDASNILKPYLEEGRIRFIGSTTYEEYNRYLAGQKSLVRRFQQIDIAEPSAEEAIEIAMGLKGGYEEFHNVSFDDDAIRFAVTASARHMSDRRLPDKVIDLMDESATYRELHPEELKGAVVDKELMADILARMCKVDSLAIKEEDNSRLETLESRIRAKIYGQDEAVTAVTQAVQMAKAGLTDPTRPLASLLFVGPTGVGKTEVAKVLAAELGVELVRFDMSEYMEKHSVAKLIGAPAGYVGYEDGGQLTAAVKRSPSCVLLLDEIEKAHQDIFNILLQVMDYGRLTDNRGNHADFRNVVLIMTSNAGARYASQASVGFARKVSAGEAMLGNVKKLFNPEFINRLSATIVFRDMDHTMASLILDKKLSALSAMLRERNVEIQLEESARELLLKRGFSAEYGGREIDRVIASMLKPQLMRAILFGALKHGGTARVEAEGDELRVEILN